MAIAENLRITHSVRNEVKVVDGKVERVEDKVEDVGDKVEDVGNRVEEIGDQVDEIKCSLHSDHTVALPHPQTTHREPVNPAPTDLALSLGSVHESQHCTKGSTQRNGGMALSGQYLHRMEVHWRFPLMDPRKACVLVTGFRVCCV